MLQAFAWGTAVVAVLDALDAIIVFGLRSGATPQRIFQSIASGLLGPAAFQGGWSTAAVGMALHVTVAAGIVGTYFLASRLMPVLARRPWVFGPLYGVAAYFVMNLVVIPLSAIGPTRLTGFGMTNGLLIHIFGVGLPAALAARRAWTTSPE